ncbi:N-acetyltransferase [Paucimonas lemoignei]|uniref:N-acetyltransferase n=1 Tax=Paucimonas lemoignei TaxID=29443 RepID=UPI001FB5031B|nr:N-acetyltransferase [Paucimonas lemoignei]
MTLPCLPWHLLPLGLRIDVERESSGFQNELDVINRRLNRPGDALYDLPLLDIPYPGLAFHYRESDGEHYVYVRDTVRQRLAGYTVFNRLIELDKRADKHLRAPHSKYHDAYQRRGIATAVYRWWLEKNGQCLVSGARQSPAAHALWHSLGSRHELFYVELRDKRLQFLGKEIEHHALGDLHTRMVLLGSGWKKEQFAEKTGMLLPPGP